MNHLPIDLTPTAAGARRSNVRGRGVVATIPLDGLPCDIVGHPKGEFIYATTAKAVHVVDRAYRVIASVPVDAEPMRTMISADGTRIYVVGYDGSLSIIDAADHSVRTAVGEASSAEVVSPTDNYIYRAHNQGRNCWVSAMSDDGTTATVIPVDSYASALALTPEGGQLFVASSKPGSTRRWGHGSIAIIDTATFTPIDVIAMALAPDMLAVSPDGHSLYATHYNNNAVSVVELGSRSQTLISLTDAPLDLAVSPDGAQLYVTNLHSPGIWRQRCRFSRHETRSLNDGVA